MPGLLVGCSYTDPSWQSQIPWSVEYSKTHPSYIVAKAGMGIKGICTEALYWLKELDNIDQVIIMLPTLWRLDIEMDVETYLCNAMVDLLFTDNGEYQISKSAKRKWIVSGGLHYSKTTEQAKIFDLMYKHQGFLVILKEHLRELLMLIDYCKQRNIVYHITAIEDPMNQLVGLDYIRDEIVQLLNEVEFDHWFRFDGKFVNDFLHNGEYIDGPRQHPTTEEHLILCKYILNNINKQGN